MSKKKFSKLLALYLPYVVIGLLATNLGRCPACTHLTCSLVCAAALECGWRCT